MTYQEMIEAYLAGGGLMPGMQPEGDMYRPRPVTMPDGTTLTMGDTGVVNQYGQLTPGHGSQGGGANYQSFDAGGGVTAPQWQPNGEGDGWKNSLAGALAVGVGGPLLGGLAAGAFGAGAGGAGMMAGTPGMEGAALGAGGAAAGGAAATAPAAAGVASGGVLSGLGGIGSTLASNPSLLGAGLGALAGLAGNQPETETREQTLPAWLQPYAEQYLSRASALSNQPMNVPGDLASAQSLIRQQANTGDPMVNAARGQQGGVIAGDMLNSNPYIDQVASNIGERMGDAYALGTRGNLSTRQAMAGGGGEQFNSSARAVMQNADRSFGDSLGSAMSNLYYGNYANERQAQDAASRGSLGFSQDWRANTEGLLNSGTQQQQYPYQQLGVLGNAINPGFGNTQSQTTPGVNNWQALLGGALGGASIGRSVWGNQGGSQTQSPLQTAQFGASLGQGQQQGGFLGWPGYLGPGY